MCKDQIECYDAYNKKWIGNHAGTLSTNSNLTGSGVFLVGIPINQLTPVAFLAPNNFSHKAGDGSKIRKRYETKVHPALQAQPGSTQATYLECEVKPLGVLRNVRSEYGKQIRKEYEAGEITVSRHSFLEKEIRNDGMSNTLDSVQKDNYMACEIAPSVIGGVGEKNFGKQYRQGNRVYDGDKIATALEAQPVGNMGGNTNLYSIEIPVKEATKKGFAVARGGRDAVNFQVPTSKTRRGRVGVDMANTLDTSCDQGIFVEISPDLTVYAVWYPKKQCYIAIRKLTPKECFRLQGWTDDYFEKAQFVNSDSQLYKQAGNGVTVNVVYDIAKRLEEGDT